jgi:N-acetylmuramoyl-L-alanine amidase
VIFAPSPNIDERECAVEFLVMHYTGMQDAASAIALLRSPEAKVSAHYVVDEDGTVYCLVPEDKRAWHAGISYWRGRRALNGASVGIEIVNPGHEWGYRAFPEAQMAAVERLSLEILGQHAIPARNVVAHSDIAPNRKQDPGELFDWKRLAASGIGVWTDDFADSNDFWGDLAAIGYDLELPRADVVRAFQRHFLPQNLSGEADELTARRAAAVRALVDPA